jgi:hypothetical protein
MVQMIALATDLSNTFTGRSAGIRFGQDLRASLKHLETAVIDFAGVSLMDATFATEAFAGLAADRSRREFIGGALLLTHLNTTSFDNLDMALNAYAARAWRLRNCCILVQQGPGLTLAGKYEDTVLDTLKMLTSLLELRTSDVMRERSIHPNAASTRLKTLHDLGLATRHEERDEQGRQFVYRWLG